LDDLAGLRLHDGNDAFNQRAGSKILAGTGLGLGGIFLQQPFIEITEAFLTGGVPVESVDVGDEFVEVARLPD
jgi:hypothetical protein